MLGCQVWCFSAETGRPLATCSIFRFILYLKIDQRIYKMCFYLPNVRYALNLIFLYQLGACLYD